MIRAEAFLNERGPGVSYHDEEDALTLCWHGEIAVEDDLDPQVVAQAIRQFLSHEERPNSSFCRAIAPGDVISVFGRAEVSFCLHLWGFHRLRGVKAATPGQKAHVTRKQALLKAEKEEGES